MKKMIIGLMMAAMVSLGFVGSTTPSSAVDCSTYNGCVVGKLRVNKQNKIQFGKQQKIRVRVTLPTAGGAIQASGRVSVTVVRIGSSQAIFKGSAAYNSTPVFFTTPKLKAPGRYKIKTTFIGNAPFGNLFNAKKNFVVKPRR